MQVSFLDKKKTFKITALQSCALTVGILQFCSRTTRKSQFFSQKSSHVQPAGASSFSGSRIQFHRQEKLETLSRKKRIPLRATRSAEHWTLPFFLARSQPCTASAAYPALPRGKTALHLTSSLLLLGLPPTFYASQKICCKGHQLRLC